MKKERNLAVAFLRNGKALFKRLQLAIRHRDGGEIIDALLVIVREFGWCVCVTCFWTCLVAGFWKPHCFIMALLYGVLVSCIAQGRKEGKLRQAEDAR